MKKTIKIFLAMSILTMVLGGCNTSETEGPTTQSDNFEEIADTIIDTTTEATTTAVPEESTTAAPEEATTAVPEEQPESVMKLSKRTTYSLEGNMLSWTDYIYDENGNRVKIEKFESDGTPKEWTDIQYNSEGIRIREADYYKGELTRLYEYNDRGLEITNNEYGAKSILWEGERREYDADGRVTKIETYNRDYVVYEAITYAYDEMGRQIYYEYKNPEEHHIRDTKNVYDDHGNVIEYTTYDETGAIVEAGKRAYQYDEAGRILSEKFYSGEGMLSGYNTFEYYANNTYSKETRYYPDGISPKVIREYYEDGRCAKEVKYYSDGVTIESIKEYSPEEGLSKYETYYKDGAPKNIREYSEEYKLLKDITYFQSGAVQKLVEYSANGVERYVLYNEDGSVKQEYVSEYDANGNCTKKLDASGKYSLNTYNDKNLCIKTEEYTSAGNLIEIFEYGYDDKGNEIAYKYINEMEPWNSCELSHEYNENNMLVKTTNKSEVTMTVEVSEYIYFQVE